MSAGASGLPTSTCRLRAFSPYSSSSGGRTLVPRPGTIRGWAGVPKVTEPTASTATIRTDGLVSLKYRAQPISVPVLPGALTPTEVLAAQHARSLRELLGDLGQAGELGGAEHATRVTLLTGSMGAAARKRALLEIVSGEAGIVVGTHALIQDKVEFADLGMVVVDEQHRFGVEQRAALAGKAGATPPHVLVMTATPIPRTVAMTVYGDLDVTGTIDELVIRELGLTPAATDEEILHMQKTLAAIELTSGYRHKTRWTASP